MTQKNDETNNTPEIILGGGMYGQNPRVEIGRFTISDNGNGMIWIDDTEDGDGAEFPIATLEKHIKDFYDKNF